MQQAVWFLVGAFLIQAYGQPATDPRIQAFADGRSVILTAHVLREGYARSAGPDSSRESIDVETEAIESDGEALAVQVGVRLAIYEKVKDRAIGPSDHRVILDEPMTRSSGDPTPLLYGARLRIRAKLHPARNYRILSGSQDSQAAGFSGGVRAFMPASLPRFTSCIQRRRLHRWTPWCSAKNRSCAMLLAPNTSGRERGISE